MLGIVNYLKSLVPTIEKENVLEDLRMTETELKTTVLPSYENAMNFFSKDKFTSKENQKINDQIKLILKDSTRTPTFLNDFYVRLKKIEKNTEIMTKLISAEMDKFVVTDMVNSKKVVLTRIAEHLSYISRYSIDLLNLVYMNEAIEANVDAREISMSPAEIVKAKNSVKNLAYLLQAYAIDADKFESDLKKAPDLVLSKTDNKDLETLYNDQDLDPTTSPFIVQFDGNPIYHIRMHIAEWQARRYKGNQEKKKVLELRLLHLNLLKEKQGTNPKLEQEIAYNQSRVAKIDRYLAEVEQDLEMDRV